MDISSIPPNLIIIALLWVLLISLFIIIKLLSRQTKTINKQSKVIDELFKKVEEQTINTKNKFDSNFHNTIKIINNLRLDNLINVSNEIQKYTSMTISDENFIKELGHCKVLRVTDKATNDITDVFYENGIKTHTETLNDGILKYSMQYNENGLQTEGLEYNDQGDVSFAYEYDLAGEVTTKIEYQYDTSGQLLDTTQTQY